MPRARHTGNIILATVLFVALYFIFFRIAPATGNTAWSVPRRTKASVSDGIMESTSLRVLHLIRYSINPMQRALFKSKEAALTLQLFAQVLKIVPIAKVGICPPGRNCRIRRTPAIRNLESLHGRAHRPQCKRGHWEQSAGSLPFAALTRRLRHVEKGAGRRELFRGRAGVFQSAHRPIGLDFGQAQSHSRLRGNNNWRARNCARYHRKETQRGTALPEPEHVMGGNRGSNGCRLREGYSRLLPDDQPGGGSISRKVRPGSARQR